MDEENEEKKPIFEYYSEVKDKEIKWLWYPFIPYGKITLVQGDPGEGKSTFMLNLVALLTRGQNLPDGTKIPHPMNVIYQCMEDDAADTIKPRLMKAGADCSKVAYIIDDTGELNLEDSRIETTIRETGAGMLILDPLQSFLVQDTDMHSAGRMRAVLGKLGAIAAKYECAIVLIGHMNKSGNKNLYRGLGSIDIAAIARSVIMVARDSEIPSKRYAFTIKSNLAPEGAAVGFSFTEAAGFKWISDIEINIEDTLIHSYTVDNKKRTATDVLLQALKDGPMYSKDIMELIEVEGVSKRTLYTVKKQLDIYSFKDEGKWFWALPDRQEESRLDGENL